MLAPLSKNKKPRRALLFFGGEGVILRLSEALDALDIS
jgi:hypothetical protein